MPRGARDDGFHPEIERKYLLRAVPPEVVGHPSQRIEQGYLASGLRVRRIDGVEGARFVLTEKRGSGLVREEREEELDAERFDLLWAETRGRRLTKRRHLVPSAGLVVEIDEFLDRVLVLAEVELPSADFALELPSWLARHVVREVTDDPSYRNSALAR